MFIAYCISKLGFPQKHREIRSYYMPFVWEQCGSTGREWKWVIIVYMEGCVTSGLLMLAFAEDLLSDFTEKASLILIHYYILVTLRSRSR